jgi:hypothetical protein
MSRVLCPLAILLLTAACCLAAEPTVVPHGRLETLNGYAVVAAYVLVKRRRVRRRRSAK